MSTATIAVENLRRRHADPRGQVLLDLRVDSFELVAAAQCAVSGAVIGYGVYLGLATADASILRRQVGVEIAMGDSMMALVIAPLVMVAPGVLAAVVPALRAYSTDVVGELTDRI